jgi:hypothetical protein
MKGNRVFLPNLRFIPSIRKVRIYALAKELKVDSKELVDICTKAGVRGKGSALACLTEEEVEIVKQFFKDDDSGANRSDWRKRRW